MVALGSPDSQLCLLNSEAISVLWVPLLHCILEILKGGCGATIGLTSLASCLSGISTSLLSSKHLKKYCLSYSIWFLMVSWERKSGPLLLYLEWMQKSRLPFCKSTALGEQVFPWLHSPYPPSTQNSLQNLRNQGLPFCLLRMGAVGPLCWSRAIRILAILTLRNTADLFSSVLSRARLPCHTPAKAPCTFLRGTSG